MDFRELFSDFSSLRPDPFAELLADRLMQGTLAGMPHPDVIPRVLLAALVRRGYLQRIVDAKETWQWVPEVSAALERVPSVVLGVPGLWESLQRQTSVRIDGQWALQAVGRKSIDFGLIPPGSWVGLTEARDRLRQRRRIWNWAVAQRPRLRPTKPSTAVDSLPTFLGWRSARSLTSHRIYGIRMLPEGVMYSGQDSIIRFRNLEESRDLGFGGGTLVHDCDFRDHTLAWLTKDPRKVHVKTASREWSCDLDLMRIQLLSDQRLFGYESPLRYLVWSWTTGRVTRFQAPPAFEEGTTVVLDDSRLAINTVNNLLICTFPSMELLGGIKRINGNILGVSPDGSFIATSSRFLIEVSCTRTFRKLYRFECPEPAGRVCFSHDNRLLAVIVGWNVGVWRMFNGKCVLSFGWNERISNLAFDQSGTVLRVVDTRNRMTHWPLWG